MIGVYIAGPMTGLPELNRPAFYSAAAKLNSIEGVYSINPAVLPDCMPDAKYLPICMAMIEAADAVYMLEGYELSIGARAERLYAKRQGKLILEEKYYGSRARITAALSRWEADNADD